MTTITDIRNDLINVFNSLRDGTMDAKDAVEINNTAGKIISSAKVQLAYAALRGEQPDIAFLRSDATPVAPESKKISLQPGPQQAPFPTPASLAGPTIKQPSNSR